MAAWPTRIVGVSFLNPDGSSRQEAIQCLQEGDRVVLQHEWSNPVDPNAIAVFTEDGRQIGYVPKKDAAKLVKTGFERIAVITEIRGGGPKAPTLGASITINARSDDGTADQQRA